MICKKCNAELPDNSKFCSICGAAVETAPAANMFCTSCGAKLAEGTMFCTECGTPVKRIAAPAPVNAMPEPVAAPAPVNAVLEPVAAPAPVNAVPEPVAAPAPVSTIPEPVAAPAPVNTIPEPVAPAPDIAAAMAASASMAAPANEQPSFAAAQTESPTAFSSPAVDLGKGGSTAELPEFNADAASAVAVKPIKKKSPVKWIILGIVLVLVAAAAVVGLCFRGVATNVVMGNNKYARMIESNGIKSTTKKLALPEEERNKAMDVAEDAMGSTIEIMNSLASTNSYEELSAVDLESIISQYYSMMMEYYGVNSITAEYDLDVQLTDSAKSMLGLDGESIDQILDLVNGTKINASFALSEDILNGSLSVTDNTGFTIDAKGIICSDGNVGVMFPFGSNKCLAFKVNTEGAVIETEEIEFDISADEVDRLIDELAEIYLTYYENAAVTIENGKELTAGGVTVKGRKITTTITTQNIYDMLCDMLIHISEDDYFMDKAAEYCEKAGLDYDKADIVKMLNEATTDAPTDEDVFEIVVETIVDFNGNVLAKTYGVVTEDEEVSEYEDDYSSYSAFGEIDTSSVRITTINGKTPVFALFAGDSELISVKQTKKNDTDGTVRLKIGTGTVSVGINIDYEGVKTAKIGKTEVPTGKYTIYMAASEDSTPDSSMFRIVCDSAVDGSTTTSLFSVEVSEYGSVAVTCKTTLENKDVSAIPSDAFNMGDITADVDEATDKGGAEYVLEALKEIRTVCESNPDSMFAMYAGKAVTEGITYFEDYLTPMASYDSIQTLLTRIDNISNNASELVYGEYYGYASSEQEDTLSDLFDEMYEYYDILQYEDSYHLEDFTNTENRISEIENEISEIVSDVAMKKAEEEQQRLENESVAMENFVGTWHLLYICSDDILYDAFSYYYEFYIELHEDYGFTMQIDGVTTYGTWECDGNVLYLDDEYETIEFVLDGDRLIFGDSTDGLEFIKR